MLRLAEKNEKQHVRQIIQQGIRGVLGKFQIKLPQILMVLLMKQ